MDSNNIYIVTVSVDYTNYILLYNHFCCMLHHQHMMLLIQSTIDLLDIICFDMMDETCQYLESILHLTQ